MDCRIKSGNDDGETCKMTTTDDPLVSTEWLAAHLGGGFAAWRDAGGPVEMVEPRKAKS